ncbi:MAG: hypothetical protein AAB875_04960 [Patescibacteria group bacterium]
MKKDVIRKWWLQLVVLALLASVMVWELFDPIGIIYVPLGVYLGLLAALIFCIIAIFIWGGDKK